MTPIDALLFVLTLAAALGCALVAGIFFAFSNFVMRALAQVPPAAGAGAMQAINVTVLNAGFLGLFMGSAALCALLALAALWLWPGAGAGLLLLGGASYLIGTFLVTIACNVPRNEALKRVDPASAVGEAYWRKYVREWTWWNHVRSAAALAAAALLVLALVRMA